LVIAPGSEEIVMSYNAGTITSIALLALLTVMISVSCESVLSPEETPERVTVNFLKAVGRDDFDSAGQWVVEESRGMISSWKAMFFFPDHQDPLTTDDENKIDRFIGNFYRVTVADEQETQLSARLLFTATDALVGFPSVADNPMVPNSALFLVTMTRTAEGDGENIEFSDWRIVSIEPEIQAH